LTRKSGGKERKKSESETKSETKSSDRRRKEKKSGVGMRRQARSIWLHKSQTLGAGIVAALMISQDL
jgi:hypothetical protein